MNGLMMWGTVIFILGLSPFLTPPKIWEYRKFLLLQRIDDLQILGRSDEADKIRKRIESVPRFYRSAGTGFLIIGAILLLCGLVIVWF